MTGLLVVAGIAVIMLPYAFNVVAKSAVINAPVMSVKSPMDGRITSDARRPGEAIAAGAPIVTVAASRQTRSRLAALQGQADSLRTRRAALDAEIAELEAFDKELAQRDTAVRALTLDMIVHDLEAIASRIEAEAANARTLRDDAARLARLADAGAVPGTVATAAQREARQAEALLATLDAERRRLEIRHAARRDPHTAPFYGEDVGYAQQRRDEIRIRLADLRTRRADIDAQVIATRREIADTSAELDRLEQFAPRAATPSVVWTAPPTTGASVAAGEELLQLLDCSRRFMEVTVAQSAHADLKPGQPAQVRLKGMTGTFQARIETVQGAGSQLQTGQLAARPERVNDDSLTVMLRLEQVDPGDPGVAASFCDVGRTAVVRFERGLGAPLPDRVKALFARLRDSGAGQAMSRLVESMTASDVQAASQTTRP